MKNTKLTKELFQLVTNDKVSEITKDKNKLMAKSFDDMTTSSIAPIITVVEIAFVEVALAISMEACPI